MNLKKEMIKISHIINLRTDDIEKEEYLEIKCELISLMNHARHILDMNDNNSNALKWIKM